MIKQSAEISTFDHYMELGRREREKLSLILDIDLNSNKLTLFYFIHYLRWVNNITLYKLSIITGIECHVLSAYETGRKFMPTDYIELLKDIFKLNKEDTQLLDKFYEEYKNLINPPKEIFIKFKLSEG